MAGEFKRWVESLDITADEKTAMLAAFNTDKLLAEADKGVMAQDRFNRGMDDLRRQQTALATRETELTTKWETANREYHEMQETVGTTTAELAAAKKKADDLAAELSTARVDPTKVITPEQLLDIRKQDAAATLRFNTEMMLIQQEHESLFGKKINPLDLYKELGENDSSPLKFWEDKYKVADKRAEIAKAAHDQEISDAVLRGKNEAIAAMANPATRTMKPSSQPFYQPEGKVKEGDTERPASGPWDEEGEFAAETALRTELEKSAYGV